MVTPRIRTTTAIKRVQRFWMILGAVFLACGAFAQTPPTTNTFNFTVNKTIPDGDPNGLSDTQTINLINQQLFNITDVQVTLHVTGGFNGDYYAYLVHNGGFAVLLNRTGRTAANSIGYGDSGFNITLSAASPNDIHNYENVSNPNGGILTGTWAEDGRNVDPANVLDTDGRTALLGSFDGQDPSGQWTLFLSDLDYGEQGQLANWGLVVTAVPEPSSMSMMALGLAAMLGLGTWLRKK